MKPPKTAPAGPWGPYAHEPSLVELPALTMPRDTEAEKVLLGVMLTDASAIVAAQRAGLTSSAFYLTKHRVIANALLECREAEIVLLAVKDKLEKRNELAQAGGLEGLTSLLEHAIAAKNAPVSVRLLLEKQKQREALELARKLADTAQRPGEAPFSEALAQAAASLQALARNTAGAVDLVTAAQRFEQSEAKPEEKPEPLLGDGLLCRGDLAVLAGKPGLGKSRLSLELAEACARGASWLGINTGSRPVRVAYFAAEFTRFRWWQRCVTLLGGKPAPEEPEALQAAYRDMTLAEDGGAFCALTADMLGEPLDLLTETGALQLEELIRERQLDLVVLDPLSRLMGGREETNEAFGKLVANLDRVKHRTRAALLLVHHERKGGTDKASRDADPLDAIRGGTVLTGAANTVLRLSRSTGGLLRLEFPKANYARTPADLWLRIPEDGGRFLLEQAPEEKGDANRQKVLAWAIAQAGPVTAGQAADALGLSSPTCRGHLSALVKAGQLEEQKGPRNALTYLPRGESRNEEKGKPSFSW